MIGALLAAWRFLRGVPWQVWALVALLGAGWYYGHTRFEAGDAAGAARVQAEFDTYRGAVKAAADVSVKAAKKAETKQAEALAAIAATHQKELTDADRTHDRVVADLRAGNLRLRDHWQGAGCDRGGDLPGAAADPGVADDPAELRNQGAADLVRLFDAADADIRALQAAAVTCPVAR